MRALLLGLAVLSGCPRKIPDHLRVDPPPDPIADPARFESVEELLAAWIERDPLVRAPRLPDPAAVEVLDGGEPLADWIREVQQLESAGGEVGPAMDRIASRHPDTAVVALARGYRLRRAENLLGNLVASDLPAVELAALLTPLRPGTDDPNLARSPLAFLGPEPGAARPYGDRWVLEGWFADPDLSPAPLAAALALPQYDGLASSPLGGLLAARATGNADPGPALADLERATQLSLTRAAADRDKEQVAWADLQKAASEELGGDPERALLRRALDGGRASAADRRGTGAGLVAATALRLLDACADPPCAGLDRVETFALAARWDPAVERLARVWQVVALKDALDTMDVGHDTILFPDAIVALVDALHGTGAGPMDLGVLRRTRADASVWLSVSRSTGGDGATDWPSTRSELATHVEAAVDRALALHPDGPFREPLERIRKRAMR